MKQHLHLLISKMENKLLFESANEAISLLKEKNLTLSTAESCTGGLVASVVTSFSGVSKIFEMGIVSYSCKIKNQELGVKNETLEKYGAVSKETAIEMAQGVREKSNSDFGLSVTGVAGPDSSENHPAGYVFICVSSKENVSCKLLNIEPKSRDYVRQSAATQLFKLLTEEIKKYK